jgi:riboflavin biosynthesis pyrimidine reductase
VRRLIISLVQSINGSFAEDGWSTGVSTDADFKNFIALRRRADAIVIDRRTALNPQLPVINAPGKALERTPVHVLTESDPDALQSQLSSLGLDYGARGFTPDTIAEVVPSLATRADSPAGGSASDGATSGGYGAGRSDEELIVCESGPNLAFRLLDSYPGAELLLSVSPRYLHTGGSHFSGLRADIELDLIDVRTEDGQVFLRYTKA